jgi:hypothetical protein
MQIFQDFNSTATLPSFSGVVLVTSLQAPVYLIDFQRNESTRLTWLAAWAPPLSVTKHSDSASKSTQFNYSTSANGESQEGSASRMQSLWAATLPPQNLE